MMNRIGAIALCLISLNGSLKCVTYEECAQQCGTTFPSQEHKNTASRLQLKYCLKNCVECAHLERQKEACRETIDSVIELVNQFTK